MVTDIESRVSAIYDAIARRDAAFLLAALRPDVVFHVPGRGRVARDYTGLAEIATMLQTASAQTNDTMRLEPRGVLANRRFAAVLHDWSATRPHGDSIEMRNLNVYRFDDEGLLAERWEFLEDEDAHDRFWE
jgi:uncharacterized protein